MLLKMCTKVIIQYGFLILIFFRLQSSIGREIYWETSLGPLIGYTKTSLSGFEFFAFEGIPYAKPPLGELRFKDPIPADPWRQVLNATHLADRCIYVVHEYNVTGSISEDCLYLNIYTRTLTKKPISDVWVQIFGGVHQNGFASSLGPDYIMDDENVIFINFDYRLNIFGFLSLNDPKLHIPGNAGAKDVVLLLQWVQNYIHEFGGNRNNVVIGGCSSGGNLVNLLMLHPLATKLFSKVIMQSGAALMDLYVLDKHLDFYAHFINYTNDIRNEKAFLSYLMQLPAQTLIEGYRKYFATFDSGGTNYPISIVVESKINNPNPFLTDFPDNLILQGKFARMPILSSFVEYEGSTTLRAATKRSNNYTRFTELIPRVIKQYLSQFELDAINKEVKDMYYQKEIPNHQNYFIMAKLSGDEFFQFPNLLLIKTMAHVSNYNVPIYLYEFNVKTPINLVSKTIGWLYPRCGHCDELSYGWSQENINGFHIRPYFNAPLVKSTIMSYTKMLIKFIRTGNPNSFDENDTFAKINWNPIQSKNVPYLVFQPNFTTATNPLNDRMKFWYRLYQRYLGDKNIPYEIYTKKFDLFP